MHDRTSNENVKRKERVRGNDREKKQRAFVSNANENAVRGKNENKEKKSTKRRI